MNPAEEGITNEESTREDDVAAAFDKHEIDTQVPDAEPGQPDTEGKPPADSGDTPPPETAPPETATSGRDAAGRFSPKSGATPAVATAPTTPAADDRLAKAPVSLKPEEAAHWKNTPKEIREAVLRREAETSRALQDSAEARRSITTLQETISPYMNNLRAAGTDPVTAIKTFFNYDNTLRHGTNLEKAQAITHLIKNYHVDIEALDSSLAGVAPRPEDAQQNAIKQALERELAPIREMMAQQRQQQEYQRENVSQTVRSGIEEFSTANPHFEKVRLDMADLIDMATARGQNLTLKDAYDRACWQNPEIRSILLAEQSRSAGAVQNTAAQRARSAAVSVRSTPVAAAGADTAARSRASDVAAAFDRHAGQE